MIDIDRAVEAGLLSTGHEYWILLSPVQEYASKSLNGYVRFPKRPTRELGYDGILSYVPVHGGITYAEKHDGSMIYGFDTLHHNSEKLPRGDPNWIRDQCVIMVKGILKAAEVEAKYLRCISSRGRAKWAEEVLKVQPGEEYNFGTMIKFLSGKL